MLHTPQAAWQERNAKLEEAAVLQQAVGKEALCPRGRHTLIPLSC